MMQNTHLPKQNELMISNFSQNLPQQKLDLGDYRFLCFVKTGLFPPFAKEGYN